MKIIIQRVLNAKCTIDNSIVGAIDQGMLLFVGIANEDSKNDLIKVANKISTLRIFEDENMKMNFSIKDIKGKILSISQFTLFAECKKGNRPSFSKAGNFDYASKMYDEFNEYLRTLDIEVQVGKFAADMKIELVNDGPVTIVIDSNEL